MYDIPSARPVVTIDIARRQHVAVTLICDTAHHFERESAETITVSKGADSTDFKLVNGIAPGEIVATQDYGLTAMCLARRARILNQDGVEHRRAAAGAAQRAKDSHERRTAQRLPQPDERAGCVHAGAGARD